MHFPKRRKAKQCSATVLQGAERGRESGPTKLLPWELRAASLHQAAAAFNCDCAHLCCISIYSVHPLVRCALRKLLLPFTPFHLRECFRGNLYFWIMRETCTTKVNI